MADASSKKGGFRALFGKRSNDDSSPRKKLSKKGSQSQGGDGDRSGAGSVANPQRQDSVSSQSIHSATRESGLPTYSDATGLTPHDYRDSPYAAINSTTGHIRRHPQPSMYMEEYRRNSEGQQQYALPLYQTQVHRSASIPQFRDDTTQENSRRVASAKAPQAKLSKANRKPNPDEILDKDTGERKDLTDMMHAFTYNDELDTVDEKNYEVSLHYDPDRADGTAMLSGVSPEVWLRVADFLTPLDVCQLSSTCRTMYTRLGRHPHKLLLDPANRPHRLNFLLAMDHKLPRHLFCFPCAHWHLRIQPGFESLKPHHVLNPLFECPNKTNIHLPPPRIRITDGRLLPFAFIQLARRSWAFGPEFGISHQTLARRWKDPYSEWKHESMYHVNDQGHVMMRVQSQHYVVGGMKPAAKRMMLYSRGDFTPYFSVCSHWKNGLLTSIPKCALDHIPFDALSDPFHAVTQLKEKYAGKKIVGAVNLCSICRPMRRCPECPTEYLFEIKMVEDKTVKSHSHERFKQALVATRWSDLGPGRSPEDREWAAVAGLNDGYDSFLEIGRRAVSGVFESAFTDVVPGQRILSMNPKKIKADEMGGDWY